MDLTKLKILEITNWSNIQLNSSIHIEILCAHHSSTKYQFTMTLQRHQAFNEEVLDNIIEATILNRKFKG